MHSRDIRSYPLPAALCFLAVFSAVFLALQGRLADGVFIISNLLPLAFGALFGMRWGIAYAVVHSAYGMVLAGLAGFGLDRLVSNGILAISITIILSGAVGRIRDLTTSLQRELGERRRTEQELQQHRAHLESLVEERTTDLVTTNDRLRLEIAERERVETERQRLEASLQRAEKMEAIGVLAGSVAHDLNNILGSLIGYPELLLHDLPEDSPMREALVTIRESGLRATAVVQDLLTMARRGVTSAEILDLNDVVSDLMQSPELLSLRAQHPGVRIAAALNPAPLSVRGSEVHLARAILNLVLNATEAIEGAGDVTISTTNVYLDAPLSRYEVLAEGEFVALTVTDTGRGIPRADIDRIFEPFYTKKVMGRSGTGLGMAIVWGTVKDHKGFVDVRSDEGRGTTVTLLFPATRESPRPEAVPMTIEDYLGHGESILVVDDVAMQRDLCAAMLKRLGYSVFAVASGEEALEHVRRQAVDLLVLDMIMVPGIDGLETYRRIVALHPGQKAVIASGFSENEQVKQAQELGAGPYIPKPYTLEKLALVVRGELRR